MKLTDQQMLDALAQTRVSYLLKKRDHESIYCVGALVYLDALIEHYRSGASALMTRDEFKAHIKEHPNSGGALRSAADDCGKQLREFSMTASIDGKPWRLRFHGPTAHFRQHDRISEKIGFEVTAEAVQERDLSLPIPHLDGRCICCPSRPPFDAYDRYCTNPGCTAHSFTKDEQRLYVTIVPERQGNYATGEALDYGFLQRPGEKARPISAKAQALLPYTTDHLAEAGLHLGKPLLYRSSRLEGFTKFGEVWVLDLAGYAWTNTLKDARSWAIVNLAHELGIKTLALYTAGNAGLSLAKVAYAARRVFKETLDIYALVPESVDPEIRTQLRAWGCRPINPIPDTMRILDHRDVWRWVNLEISGQRLEVPPEHAWHVTDGWDGVGVLMYRLLFAEAFASNDFDYAVVPLGTGSLFLGTYLALLDTYDAAAAERLVGAIPTGPNNILANFAADRPPAHDADASTMPKLDGRYSPLTPVVKHITMHGAKLIPVTPKMHTATSMYLARDFYVDDADPLIAFEPSAAAAASALVSADSEGLREQIEKSRPAKDLGDIRVLVANTGLGALGARELDFLKTVHHLKV